MATIEICSRTLHGQVNQAEVLIDGDLGPDSRVAGVVCRAVQPGVITKLSLLRDGVKDPEALAGPDIKAAHVSFVIAIADWSKSFPKSSADNHSVFGHDWRRVQTDLAGGEVRENRLIIVELEVNDAILPEGRHRHASFGI